MLYKLESINAKNKTTKRATKAVICIFLCTFGVWSMAFEIAGHVLESECSDAK